MKKGNNKDVKLWAYLVGYGIALAFLLLPYLADASVNHYQRGGDPINGFNYRKHYKKQHKKSKRYHKGYRWTGEGCGINR